MITEEEYQKAKAIVEEYERQEQINDFDADWEDDDDFQECDDCDGHDACADFGCAIKAGIISPQNF